jgi:hypothetical protein
MNILCIKPFCPQKTHNRTLFFGNILLKHGRHFDYWKQPLYVLMRISYLGCYKAELCCYLVIHIGNISRPLLPLVTCLLTLLPNIATATNYISAACSFLLIDFLILFLFRSNLKCGLWPPKFLFHLQLVLNKYFPM